MSASCQKQPRIRFQIRWQTQLSSQSPTGLQSPPGKTKSSNCVRRHLLLWGYCATPCCLSFISISYKSFLQCLKQHWGRYWNQREVWAVSPTTVRLPPVTLIQTNRPFEWIRFHGAEGPHTTHHKWKGEPERNRPMEHSWKIRLKTKCKMCRCKHTPCFW